MTVTSNESNTGKGGDTGDNAERGGWWGGTTVSQSLSKQEMIQLRENKNQQAIHLAHCRHVV